MESRSRRLWFWQCLIAGAFLGLNVAPAQSVEGGPSVAGHTRARLSEEVHELRRQIQSLKRHQAEHVELLEGRLHELEERSRRARDRDGPWIRPPTSNLPATVSQTAAAPMQQPEVAGQNPAAKDEKQEQESALDRALRELKTDQESPLERAIRDLPPTPQPIASARSGALQFQLMDISLDGLFAVGTSTQKEASLQQLEGGGHDPHKRGFTVQNVELFLAGAVDPYLDGAMNLIHFIDPEGETVVELEEAYFTTRALPYGLQLKAGQFFTEFGRINPKHPHSWLWQDQPVINSRLFGPDGMRGPGVLLSWLVPVEWFSQVYVGTQNANGETMTSFLASEEFFEERPVAGRPFVERDVRALNDLHYLVRWENSWNTWCDEVTWLLGASGVFGPNATGLDGHTEIYGADLTMKWKPSKNERGWPFVVWETEIINRRYVADNFSDLGDPLNPLDDMVLSGQTLRDWGFYTQVLYGCQPRWAVGLRYEYVRGNGPSLDEDFAEISRNEDPFRDERHRLAPLLAWYPTEFSRFRFQYNFDYAEHLIGKDAHSFWIGAEWLYGAHAAHKF